MPSVTPLAQSLRKAPGNATQEEKDYVAEYLSPNPSNPHFCSSIIGNLEGTHMDICDIPDEKNKKLGRIVFETDVTKEMCNAYDNVHGGCTATLIDICTSAAFSLLEFRLTGKPTPHVSLTLDVTYHAPAPIGCRMKIVCSTVSYGKRVMTAKAEVYDKTHGRLAATGVHIKMSPSKL